MVNKSFTKDAHVVFDEIPHKNVVCWSALLAGYVQFVKHRKAMEFFREMQLARVTTDYATITSAISSCAQMCALKVSTFSLDFCLVHIISFTSGFICSLFVGN